MKKYTKCDYTKFVLGIVTVLAMSGWVNATTINSSKDSYIRGSSFSGINYGSETNAMIKLNDANSEWTRKTYLGFDLSTVSSSITAASLDIEFIDSGLGTTDAAANFDFDVYGLNDGTSDNWVESGITWNNAPANTAGGGVDLNAATWLGSFSRSGKGLGSVSFSSGSLLTFLNADVNDKASFILVRTTGATTANYVHSIATKENTSFSSPSLTLIPEPSVLGMIVVFSGGIVFIRRRLIM